MRKNSVLLFSLFILLFVGCKKDKNVVNPEVSNNPPAWFSVTNITPDTFSLEERESSQENVSYLIVGENKAIMFDTGSGENSAYNGTKIKYVIDSLTVLTPTLLQSHFHFDHNQNISEFDQIAFPDIPLLRQRVSEDNVYPFSAEDLFYGDFPSQVIVDEWLPLNTDIDLGNRIIQLINIPGHTLESIAIVDKTNKMVFLGDYLYNGTLFVFNPKDLESYEESVDSLISTLDADYRLFGAHGTPEVAYEKLQQLKGTIGCINNDKCPSTSATVFGETVLIYQFQNIEILIFQ